MSSMDMAAIEAKLAVIMAQLEARDVEKKELEAEIRAYREARESRESELEARLRAQEEEITRAYAALKEHEKLPNRMFFERNTSEGPSGVKEFKTPPAPQKPIGVVIHEIHNEEPAPPRPTERKSYDSEMPTWYKPLEGTPYEEKIDMLDRKFKMMEESNKAKDGSLFDPWSVMDQGSALLPQKFKMPEIEKFDGTGCPSAHVESYTWAMKAKGMQFEVMASCFHLTLSGAAKEWFMSLPMELKRDWVRAAQLFQKRYQDNTYYRATKRELERTVQASGESFGAFATRWRAKMNKLVDRPDAVEQIYLFTKCLNDEYQEKLCNSYWPDFAAIYEAGMRIEEFSRLKKNKTPAYNSGYRYSNKVASSEAMPKDNSVNAVSVVPTRGPAPVRNNPPARPAKRQYSNLGGRSLEAVFHTLVKEGKVKPLEGFRPKLMGENWAHDKWCEYHQFSGHMTNECFCLKDLVQDLIDRGEIEAPPNTVRNPLPNDMHAIEFEGPMFDSTKLVVPAVAEKSA